jgi:hypothetical protein
MLQVISAVSSSGTKASATVLAEDKTSGLVLRADVILDRIHSLRVRGFVIPVLLRIDFYIYLESEKGT